MGAKKTLKTGKSAQHLSTRILMAERLRMCTLVLSINVPLIGSDLPARCMFCVLYERYRGDGGRTSLQELSSISGYREYSEGLSWHLYSFADVYGELLRTNSSRVRWSVGLLEIIRMDLKGLHIAWG